MKRNRRFAGLFVCLLGAALTAGTRSLAATAAKPTFSQGHGFYSSSFSVRISSATAGATIRYTTDGSAPGTSAGTVLANGGSVTINTTTCLRACAVSAGMTTSQPFTQTYIFLSHVLTQTKPAGYPSYWSCTDSGYPATRPADYNMDSVVVNDSRYKGTIQNDLKSIPSLSIVMKRTDLFGASGGTDGVYMQGGYTGGKNTLEKPGSVELIYPDGRAGFQIDCGIKPHSGCDHKRSLRLLFKSNYGGPVKLDYPFYEDAPMNRNAGPNTFGKIFLRAGCNESWSTWWNLIDGKKAWVAYIRDQFTRNSFIDMTGRGGRNLFVHLYLNGMYWGIYDACERPDARFAADRWGGSKADWFARNTAGTISGSATRWNYLHSTLVPAGGFANASKYNTVKQYLDIEDFCDYIILNWYVGTDDWPGNNYYVVNRNNPAGPLLYLCWDADTSWGVPWGGGCNPDGAWVHPAFTASGHKHDNRENAKLWRALDDNTDFLITFADRFYKHGYNGGELTDANARARWDTLAAAVERAVVGESARWGDALMASHGQPRYTLDDHWKPARTAVRNMITGNTDTLKSAMRAVGYYPSIDPPTYQQHGGTVAAGFKLTISRSQTGTIYYRTDGSDPRVSGGGVLSGTPASTSPVVLTLDSTTTVKARLKNAATWSALAEATFTVTGSVPQPPAAPGGLAAAAQSVSEIRLTWTDNSSNETGFKIERSPNGSSSWSQIATPTANATTYTDSGLAAAATFYYRVRAYNGAGNSPYSGIAGATTQQGLPAAPGGLAAAAQSVSEIRLTWT
ncbi:MAG: CotH kinase family protein, partial [Kiritimatiellae bacterium]|nr:CotH kinase family protein [Kiritimatiellia bacterium]